MNKKLRIGLFGFGCVGQGLYDILCSNDHFHSEVVKICVKDPDKQRTLPKERFVYNRKEILSDDSVDLIVELISDADEALIIAREALAAGKTVISANKKMIAENFSELHQLQEESGGKLLYEAACCGSIPIIRNLEEYFDNEPLQSISGIFNGSSNFILSRIFNDDLPYNDALKQAQQLGYAEADPTLDVSGRDAANKLSIILAHAFGAIVHPDQIFTFGIQRIQQADLDFARKYNLKIKSIAKAQLTTGGSLLYYVLPAFVGPGNENFHVENELNTVVVNGKFSGRQQLTGKGAGGHPTGSAVLSDISASLYNYKYGYKKLQFDERRQPVTGDFVEIYLRYRKTSLPAEWGITHIDKTFRAGDDSQAICRVSMQELNRLRPRLEAEEVFIADLASIPAGALRRSSASSTGKKNLQPA